MVSHEYRSKLGLEISWDSVDWLDVDRDSFRSVAVGSLGRHKTVVNGSRAADPTASSDKVPSSTKSGQD
jgi:hypothetical protein